MWRPVTRNSLFFTCAIVLFAGSGCSLFHAGFDSSMISEAPRPLPEMTVEMTAEMAPAPASSERPAASYDGVPSHVVAARAQLPLAESSIAATDAETDDEPDAAASCYVEIRASGEKPKKIRMLLSDAAYVQKVLEQTGLVKQFRNMDIELSRKLPDGTRHKLDIRYDAKQNRVISAFDYALHPNDLLVVRQDSSTSFDDMLKRLAGPLAR